MFFRLLSGIARYRLPAVFNGLKKRTPVCKTLCCLLACLWFGLCQPLRAQCPPPGFPDPGNTCPLAPILCENLDGYCSTINNNNTVQSFPGCSGAWTLNNDE